MAADVTVYNDFMRGEAGRLGLTKPPETGYFSGKNVLVYANGLLGPRPGWKKLTVSGVPNGRVITSAAAEVVGAHYILPIIFNGATRNVHMGLIRPDAASPAWFNGASFLADTSEGMIPASIHAIGSGGGLAYFNSDMDLHRFEAGAHTKLKDHTNSITAVALYGARVVYADHGRNTLFYSQPDSHTLYPATNFVKVGESSGIRGLAAFRGSLYIFKLGEVWVLQGAIGTSSARLSRLDTNDGVLYQNHLTVTPDGVWAWCPGRRTPVVFDGVRWQPVDHLDIGPLSTGESNYVTPPHRFGVAACTGQLGALDVLYAYGTGSGTARMTVLHNGTWTVHEHTLPITGEVHGSTTSGHRLFTALTAGTDTTPPGLYVWQPSLDRPGFTSDAFARPGDDSTTPLAASASMPEFWTEPGDETRVRQVIVDLVKWNTGSATANQLDIAVDTFGRRGTPGEGTDSQSWSETGVASSVSGTRHRLVFDFGTGQPGAGFQVRFPVIRGCAIRSVTVKHDALPGRP